MAGGHFTDFPKYMTYFSVVSHDTVRIGFLVADLNNLDVLASDIHNAFLEAPNKEKIFFCAGDYLRMIRTKLLLLLDHFTVSNFLFYSSGIACLKP